MQPVDFATYNKVLYAKNQPQYQQLPAMKFSNGDVVTKWKMTIKERLHCLIHGSIYLRIKTFNGPLQPVCLSINEPSEIDDYES